MGYARMRFRMSEVSSQVPHLAWGKYLCMAITACSTPTDGPILLILFPPSRLVGITDLSVFLTSRNRMSNPPPVSVPRLGRWKVLRWVVLVAAFESVFEILCTKLIADWRALIMVSSNLGDALILFVFGVRDNYRAAFVKRNTSISVPLYANGIYPSVILVQKAEIILSVIAEAAYKAAVEALHSLPDRSNMELGRFHESFQKSSPVLVCICFTSARELQDSLHGTESPCFHRTAQYESHA